MHQYGVREVEKLLRLPSSTIRGLVKAGFVSPARGPRNTFRFSFQDLIVLRTAQALAADPVHLDAHINLGRLLHEAGRLAEAERVYRNAIAACGSDPVLLYNLGVLLEDMDRKNEAMEAYESALHRDPRLADCHYNLALLCEELNKPKQAIRHMAQYRRLAGTKSD